MDIYLVGGAVRDTLLAFPFHERDWVVVGANPAQLLDQGYQPVGKDFPVFLHPETKEEYALARTERKTGNGYTGFECYSHPAVTLEEDLLRRDLTINAMAQRADGEIIDPYRGQYDLKDKILRHVSDAFTEDPLRVLRVARFYARYYHLGFQIAEQTYELMKTISASGELLHLSRERIWREMERSLSEQSPAQFFLTLQKTHALETLFPLFGQLTAQHFRHLAEASHAPITTAQRFSLLFFDLDSAQAPSFLTQIKAPKEYKELALLISQQGKYYCHKTLDAELILQGIEQLDALRRPERFESFLQCCELYDPQQRNTQQLRNALTICQTIQAKTFVARGLKGKEIAAALKQAHLSAIRSHISHS